MCNLWAMPDGTRYSQQLPFGTVMTAMITPFDADGAVNYDQFHRLCRFLISHGSDSLVVTGTTGESPTLTSAEKLALYAGAVEAVGGKTPVIAGTGTYDTRASVEATKAAADHGVDGILAVTPYYSKPSQRMLVAHFTAIADATELPVIVYNIPGRTGTLIEIPTLVELAQHPRIVATKDAVGDVGFSSRTRQQVQEGFIIYSGDDANTLPMMSVGGSGVISVASHLVGNQIKKMVTAAASGDLAEATRFHDALLPTFLGCFLEPNPVPLKGAMSALWEPMGPPRLPLLPALDETTSQLVAAVGKAQSL